MLSLFLWFVLVRLCGCNSVVEILWWCGCVFVVVWRFCGCVFVAVFFDFFCDCVFGVIVFSLFFFFVIVVLGWCGYVFVVVFLRFVGGVVVFCGGVMVSLWLCFLWLC